MVKKPRRLTFLNKFFRFPKIVEAGAVLAPWVNEWRLPYPYQLIVVVTRRCNSRCHMCNIWRQKDLPELALSDYQHIFTKDDWGFIRSLALTGGEPTMRNDLPEIFQVVAQNCQNLAHVYLATSGLNTERTLGYVEQMLNFSQSNVPNLHTFQVQISVDGIGELHDNIRGVPGFFKRVQQTISGLRELQSRFPVLSMRLSTVVLPQNLAHIPEIRQFAKQEGLLVHFSPVVLSSEYYENENTDLTTGLATVDQYKRDTAQLFDDLADKDHTEMQFSYRDIAHMLRGAERGRRCMLGFYECVLEYDAQVYACVNCESYSFGNLLETPFEELWFGAQATRARQLLRQNCCPSCPSPCHAPPINGWELLKFKLHRFTARLRNLFDKGTSQKVKHS